LPSEKRLYTVAEVAIILNLSRSTLYELIWCGALEAVKIGRARRISVAAIDDFLERLEAHRGGDLSSLTVRATRTD
jgi:excisionase family DNA binding protein